MRLLHIVPSAVRGGIEKNCYHFIKSTPAIDQQIVVLTGDGPMVNEWRSLGVDVEVLDVLKFGLFKFYSDLKSKLPDGPFETVIVWTNNRMPAVLSVLKKYQGVHVLVHIGNPVAPGVFKLRLQSALLPSNRLANISLRAVSNFVKETLGKNSYYTKYKCRVSLKPVETGKPGKRPSSLQADSLVKCGMVARLDSIKDHPTVLGAFVTIRSRYPRATLHLAGDGQRRQSLETLAATLRISDSVIFHGDVPDVPGLLADWDLFLYASTMNEGLGGTVPEALAAGLPVVSVDLPMIREWDQHGKYVAFCRAADPADLAEKAIALLGDHARRTFVYENAPRYVRDNFSPEKFSQNYLSDTNP